MLRPGEITKQKYDYVCGLSKVKVDLFWRQLCNSPDFSPKNVTVYMYADEQNAHGDNALQELFDINESGDYAFMVQMGESSPSQASSQATTLTMTLPSQVELITYLDPDRAQKHTASALAYSYWLIVLDPRKDQSAKSSVHVGVMVFHHPTRKIYFMDPNANRSVFGARTGDKLDRMFAEYFAQTAYTYVSASEWRSDLSIQITVGKRSYDHGNCLALCLLFTHWLSYTGTDPTSVYDGLAALPEQTKTNNIYNYICGLYDWFHAL